MAGALFGPGSPRLVEVDGVRVECHLAGHLLFFRNSDVPGVVGRIGTILGEGGVNIAGIQLGRAGAAGEAVSTKTRMPCSIRSAACRRSAPFAGCASRTPAGLLAAPPGSW